MALGATMAAVVRQLMAEALVWAGAGTAGGLVIATWFVQLFGAAGVSTAVPYDFEPRVDARVVVAVAALLLVSVLATALVPSVLTVRRSRDLVPKRTWGSHGLGRRVTVALQVSLSIVLMSSAAGLLLRFQSLSALTTASRTSKATVAMEVSLSEIRYADAAGQRVFFDRLLTALAARAGIRAVGAASYVPPARPLGNVRFSVEGRAASTDAQTALASAVDPSAFALLDIPLVRGRLIDRRDGAAAPQVAVISAALARRYWPTDDPIGRRIALVGSEKPITIVGVVGDVRQPLSGDPRAESVLYLSYQQNTWPFMTLIVEPSATRAAAVAAVRQEVARIDPSQAIGAVRPLDEIRTEWLAQPRVQTTIVSLFGVATLLLTLVGLYARVAHSVVVRAREFAIRQALGARPADVVRGLTTDALVVVAIGVVAGFALLPLSTIALRRLIVEAPAFDIRIVSSVAALLLAGAFVSAYGPARRAGRVNTAELLKAE
jgi:predicted permease